MKATFYSHFVHCFYAYNSFTHSFRFVGIIFTSPLQSRKPNWLRFDEMHGKKSAIEKEPNRKERCPIRNFFKVKINQQTNFSCFKNHWHISAIYQMSCVCKCVCVRSQSPRERAYKFSQKYLKCWCRWMPTRDRKMYSHISRTAINTRFYIEPSRYYVQLKLTKTERERNIESIVYSNSFGFHFNSFVFRSMLFEQPSPSQTPIAIASVIVAIEFCKRIWISMHSYWQIFRYKIRISITSHAKSLSLSHPLVHSYGEETMQKKTRRPLAVENISIRWANVLKLNSSIHISKPTETPSVILRVVH